MALKYLVPKLLHLSPDMIKEVSDYREARKIKTQASAVRALLRMGLDTANGAETTQSKDGAGMAA